MQPDPFRSKQKRRASPPQSSVTDSLLPNKWANSRYSIAIVRSRKAHPIPKKPAKNAPTYCTTSTWSLASFLSRMPRNRIGVRPSALLGPRWQTRRTQNPVGLTPRVGSTPTSGIARGQRNKRPIDNLFGSVGFSGFLGDSRAFSRGLAPLSSRPAGRGSNGTLPARETCAREKIARLGPIQLAKTGTAGQSNRQVAKETVCRFFGKNNVPEAKRPLEFSGSKS